MSIRVRQSPLRGPALTAMIAGVLVLAGLGLGNANVYSLTLRQTVIPVIGELAGTRRIRSLRQPQPEPVG